MTLTIRNTQPRNPLIAPTLFRRAGLHRRCNGGVRQRDQRNLLTELRRSDLHIDRRSTATRDRHSP